MDIDQKEYRTVILGALLHDIGKMLQRGSFGSLDTSGKHPQVSAIFVNAFKEFFSQFVDVELLRELVQRHHEDTRLGPDIICQNAPDQYRSLCYLVSQADNYSSSERGDKAEAYQDFKLTPLVSVFSRLSIGQDTPDGLKYHLRALKPDCAFPENFGSFSANEFNAHLESFGQEFSKIASESKRADFDTLLANMHTLLLKYAWCIPSNTQEQIPDISLYDHLKTTCAIAACMYQYHYPVFDEKEIRNAEVEKFMLVVGDLSGIQNYIFDIKHIGSGGVAKRLRARSFHVNMFSEIISHKILHAFNLPLANILMSSGGKFYILLPNSHDVTEKLDCIEREIDQWFYKQLHAEINVNIAAIALSGNCFKIYGETLNQINISLQKKKRRPLESILIENSRWNTDKAVLDVLFEAEDKLCKACERFPGIEREDGKVICDRCSDDKLAGQLLPNAEYIAFYRDHTGTFKIFDYSYDILQKPHPKNCPYILINISKAELNSSFPAAHRFVANHISKFIGNSDCDRCSNEGCEERSTAREGQPKYFECIANESKGRKMLGYLKADVDNLGAIFTGGLKDRSSVSRLATLSRMFDTFFSGFMQDLIETNYPELYTVFSGGDDLLVIGPWDIIMQFAKELNDEFHRYTCNNRNLTISAGIVFVKSKYPIFRAVEMADIALDASKDAGKDRLTVFGQTVEWKQVSEMIKEAETLTGWLKNKNLSAGFARNLLTYSWMFNEFSKTKRTDFLRFLPLLTYDIARNLPPLSDKDPDRRKVRAWAEELKNLNSPILHNLGIIANYALTANRGGNDE